MKTIAALIAVVLTIQVNYLVCAADYNAQAIESVPDHRREVAAEAVASHLRGSEFSRERYGGGNETKYPKVYRLTNKGEGTNTPKTLRKDDKSPKAPKTPNVPKVGREKGAKAPWSSKKQGVKSAPKSSKLFKASKGGDSCDPQRPRLGDECNKTFHDLGVAFPNDEGLQIFVCCIGNCISDDENKDYCT